MSLEDESVFDRVSEETETRRERLYYIFDQFVRAPVSILISDWRTLLGIGILGFYGLMASIGVMLVREPRTSQAPQTWLPPFENWAYPLGSDSLAQGILALTVHSTPAMFEMAFAGGLFTVVVGTLVGTTSGYLGGRTDAVLSTFSDIMMTIPGLPLIIVISTMIKPTEPWFVGLILAFNAWAALARQLRSEVLSMRQLGYIKASRTMGLPTRTIVFKDIIPNLMSYITVNFVRAGRNVIFASVGLYFLGILPFTNQNWGVMLNEAYQAGGLSIPSAYHSLIVPMFAITFFTLGLTLLAQGSDRMFNPRVRVRHAKTTNETAHENQ